ncbi:MAG: DNA polymerase III subunit [Spartobacteria bacterium]|nr:DNA polymerase III subunit [Spartobacteria bacterium]
MDYSLNQHNEQMARALIRSVESDRLAHAYTVAGAPRGQGFAFAVYILQYLFCTADERPCGTCSGCQRVRRRIHPDVHWVEPEKKTRIFGMDPIRELNHVISESSYEGGWKAGVILFADRLSSNRAQAANVLLKTLEEPPPRTLLMLVTDAPQAMLPTIVSRCQRIVLSDEDTTVGETWLPELHDILAKGSPADPLGRAVLARGLENLLATERKRIAAEEKEKEQAGGDDESELEERKEVLDARIEALLKEVRANILRCLILWQRDVLLLTQKANPELLYFGERRADLERLAARLTTTQALARVRAADEIIRRLDRNLPYVGGVLDAGWSKLGGWLPV